MIREIRTWQQPLTRELAEDVATMPKWAGERELKDSHKAALRAKLDDGLFHSPTWSFAWCGGRRYRVDGQHSSTMLTESNGRFPDHLTVTIKEFACDTPEDLAELFSQFDQRLQVRSTKDTVNTHRATIPALSDVSPTMAVNVVTGIAQAMSDDGRPPRLGDNERGKLLRGNEDFALWARRYVGLHWLRRGPIVAAMFRTYRLDAEAATRFWDEVRDESAPDPRSGSRVLAKFLTEIKYINRAAPGKVKWDTRSIYIKCLHGWNAWRRRKTTDLKYHAESPVPPLV